MIDPSVYIYNKIKEIASIMKNLGYVAIDNELYKSTIPNGLKEDTDNAIKIIKRNLALYGATDYINDVINLIPSKSKDEYLKEANKIPIANCKQFIETLKKNNKVKYSKKAEPTDTVNNSNFLISKMIFKINTDYYQLKEDNSLKFLTMNDLIDLVQTEFGSITGIHEDTILYKSVENLPIAPNNFKKIFNKFLK